MDYSLYLCSFEYDISADIVFDPPLEYVVRSLHNLHTTFLFYAFYLTEL